MWSVECLCYICLKKAHFRRLVQISNVAVYFGFVFDFFEMVVDHGIVVFASHVPLTGGDHVQGVKRAAP